MDYANDVVYGVLTGLNLIALIMGYLMMVLILLGLLFLGFFWIGGKAVDYQEFKTAEKVSQPIEKLSPPRRLQLVVSNTDVVPSKLKKWHPPPL